MPRNLFVFDFSLASGFVAVNGILMLAAADQARAISVLDGCAQYQPHFCPSLRTQGDRKAGMTVSRVTDKINSPKDGYSTSSVPSSDIPNGLRELAQTVALLDDRRDLSGFYQLVDDGQVFLAPCR